MPFMGLMIPQHQSYMSHCINVLVLVMLSPHQVAGEQYFGAIVCEVLECGDGSTNTCVIGDVQVLVQRHIEISTDLHTGQ